MFPLQGFKYLYLTPQDYKKVSALNSVHCDHVEDEGESRYALLYCTFTRWGNESVGCCIISQECMTPCCQSQWDYNRGDDEGESYGRVTSGVGWIYVFPCRYKITDIIGKDEGLGVENLKGSGMIAGESSLAYDEIITMNLVRVEWTHLCTTNPCRHIASSLALSSPLVWSLEEQRLPVYKELISLQALTWLCWPAGHMQSHRDRGLSGEARTENHSSGQLSHYPDWSRSPQQGHILHHIQAHFSMTQKWLIQMESHDWKSTKCVISKYTQSAF